MRTPWIWCVNLGRWWNVQVYLHMFFVLFLALAFFVSFHIFPVSVRIAFMGTLFASVVWHEIAHVVVARRLGGVADEIVITPVGGLSAVRVPYEPQSEFVALTAGILANTAVCLVAGILLLAGDAQEVSLAELLSPFAMGGLIPEQAFSYLQLLRLAFWINWTMAIVNLIPAFPLDGRTLASRIGRVDRGAAAPKSAGLAGPLGRAAGIQIVAAFSRPFRIAGLRSDAGSLLQGIDNKAGNHKSR